MARIGTAESVDAVIPFLSSEDAGQRTDALDALKTMIGAVRPRLPQLLRAPDVDIRVLCCELARDLAPADATALLSRVLERDPDVNVCGAAIDVLADVGTAAALTPLARCADRFAGQPFLVFAVHAAIDRISAFSDPRD